MLSTGLIMPCYGRICVENFTCVIIYLKNMHMLTGFEPRTCQLTAKHTDILGMTTVPGSKLFHKIRKMLRLLKCAANVQVYQNIESHLFMAVTSRPIVGLQVSNASGQTVT